MFGCRTPHDILKACAPSRQNIATSSSSALVLRSGELPKLVLLRTNPSHLYRLGRSSSCNAVVRVVETRSTVPTGINGRRELPQQCARLEVWRCDSNACPSWKIFSGAVGWHQPESAKQGAARSSRSPSKTKSELSGLQFPKPKLIHNRYCRRTTGAAKWRVAQAAR